MELLEGVVRGYDWGSRVAIQQLLGRPATGERWAELWLGAHPAAPAVLPGRGERLDRLIVADPVAALGPAAASRFGRLPFLLKILAAAEPLSLQAHPSAEQAAAGFEREEAMGVPRDAPRRIFPDPGPKPELVCALESFEALCGFRQPGSTLRLLDTLESRALDPIRSRLRAVSKTSVRDVLAWVLTLDAAAAGALADAVAGACASCAAGGSGDEWAATRAALARLGAAHRGDAGVVAALLLNHVMLAPGEAMFVPPGRLHAYLGGVAVEVMADSDNTIRGGLTSKHVDAAALLEVAESEAAPVGIQRPAPVRGIISYRAPVPEFSLQRIEVDDTAEIAAGPAVLLCVSGRVEADGVALSGGDAAWSGFDRAATALTGRAVVFRAGLGEAR